MSKEELIKATQILQKHVPNRFPLKNSYIEAMREYAEWYHEELSKLHQPTVIVCLHPFNEVVSGDDGDFCCKCQTYLKSNRL